MNTRPSVSFDSREASCCVQHQRLNQRRSLPCSQPHGRKRRLALCCCQSSTSDSFVTGCRSRKPNVRWRFTEVIRSPQMDPVLVCVCGGGFVLIDGIAARPTQSAGELDLAKFNKRKFLSVIDVDTGRFELRIRRRFCALRITIVEECLQLPAGNRKTSIKGFRAQREDNGFQEREQAGARSPVLPVLVWPCVITALCSCGSLWNDTSTTT